MYCLNWLKSANRFRRFLNIWPPLLGAGIKIDHISEDWMHATVSIKLRFYNRNFYGTQFGGSLFAMNDPIYSLLITHHLGRTHRVWDQSAEIEYIKPGAGKVIAHFTLTQDRIDHIREQTKDNQKHLAPFDIDVTDENGETVAKIKRVIYIRKKPEKKEA